MSRHAALKLKSGETVRDQLRRQGIIAVAKAVRALGEEAPEAYKDIDEVVGVCAAAGLSSVVARLEPLGVLKG
jgi:tRNA-splicing ligase RtcB